MLSAVLSELANPELVVRFQRWCGVEQVVVEAETTTTATTTPAAGYGDRSPLQSSIKDCHGAPNTRLQQQPQSSATATEIDRRCHHHQHAPVPEQRQRSNNNDDANDVGDDVRKNVGRGGAGKSVANGAVTSFKSVASGAAANGGAVDNKGGAVANGSVVVVANSASGAKGPVVTNGIKANGAKIPNGTIANDAADSNGGAVVNGTVHGFGDVHAGASFHPLSQVPTHTKEDDDTRSSTTYTQSPTTANHPAKAPPATTLTHRGGTKQYSESCNHATGAPTTLSSSSSTSTADCRLRSTPGGAPTPTPTTTRVLIRYPILYYWAKVGATLGNEEFYLTGMPYLLWTVDSTLIRQLAVLWWLVMYVGQATKDYLEWPRPPSPPVIRLETTHLAEFSMPSTHAMAGTAIPCLLSSLILERYDLPAAPVLSMAFLWCATTCLSRLYLGVHTVLDVICGVLIALVLYALLSPLIYRYDYYQQTHPLAPLVLLLTSLALCTVCYPSNSKNSAKGDAIVITAVFVGVGIGTWLNYSLGFSVETPKPDRMPVMAPTLSWFGTSLLQFVVGVAVVFALKSAVKWATVRFFCAFLGLDRLDTQHPSVMVGYKYTTYLCLGLAIAFLDPLLFTALGFGRPNYYREVV